MKENHYKGLQNAIFRGSGLVILFVIMSVLVAGCDDNNNSNENESLRAVLSVQESPNVPGRIELDPRGSKPGAGQKLVSFTIEVIDTSTGETVFGPVTESANSDSAILREYFPNGDYLAILTVIANTILSDDVTAARGPEGQQTDTDEKEFSVDANISFPEDDSCQATCSARSSIPDQTVCTLPTDCFTLDLDQDVLAQAKRVVPSIDENTKMWIQVYGGSGGNGTDNTFGGDGGKAGPGGFAQTITSVAGYESQFSTTTLFYYLGEAGTHDDSGGSGGASTIISSVEPLSGNTIALNDLVLIAGGGGGGGEGNTFDPAGTNGGGGGFAYSKTVGQSDIGVGANESSNNPTLGGQGGGGTTCMEGIACGGGGDIDGHQGFGGESGGSANDPGPRKWINGTPELEDDAGKGGEGVGTTDCDAGGGGGGFGGGGGSTVTSTEDPDGPRCLGGGGGGSYASASTTTDSDAPSTNPDHSGDGEVIIIFNTDPPN